MASAILSSLIDKSYEIFSKYQATRPLDVCTYCCMKPEREALLASLPVREIPRELLAEYNDDARSAKTPIEELKHFLPRYLDLIAQFQFPTHSAELSLARLDPFYESEWTTEEIGLLQDFSKEFFRHCLSIYPLSSGDDITSVLIMFWRAKFNVMGFLSIWEQEKKKSSVLHFRDLYFQEISNPFSEKELKNIFRNWLDSEKARQNFAEAIEQLIMKGNRLGKDNTDQLSLLYDIIRVRKNVI